MGRLNRPARPNYQYRSPNQTNANDLVPNPLEEVIPSQNADARRIVRGLSPDAAEGHRFSEVNRRRQQEAGGRATVRSALRGGAAGLAFEAGKKFGEDLDKKDPTVGPFVEKVIEKSGLGKAIAGASVTPGRVELTDEAKARVRGADNERERAEKAAFRELSDNAFRGERYKKGGMVKSASSRADGIAQRGKTKGRMI